MKTNSPPEDDPYHVPMTPEETAEFFRLMRECNDKIIAANNRREREHVERIGYLHPEFLPILRKCYKHWLKSRERDRK